MSLINTFLNPFSQKHFILLITITLASLLVKLNSQEGETLQHISVLACAALAKKMTEIPSQLDKFEKLVSKFSERINYEPEQTRNFVNLLLLNHCFSKITFEDASVIIKERAETKNVSSDYISFLNLDHCFDDYIRLDGEEKKVLFRQLAGIKESLKGLTESLGEASREDFGSNSKSSSRPAQSSKSASNGNNNNKKSNEEDSPLNLFKFFYLIILIIFRLIVDNIYIFIFAIVLTFIVSLVGKKRLRRKVKKEDKSNDTKKE